MVVGVSDSVTYLSADIDRLKGGHVPLRGIEAFEARLQSFPDQVLHDHVVGFTVDVEVVDLDNIGMAQAGDRRSFFFEAVYKIGVYR